MMRKNNQAVGQEINMSVLCWVSCNMERIGKRSKISSVQDRDLKSDRMPKSFLINCKKAAHKASLIKKVSTLITIQATKTLTIFTTNKFPLMITQTCYVVMTMTTRFKLLWK